MLRTTVSILEGNTFALGALNGDMHGSPSEPHGLFHRDTRFLSRWQLTVDGKPLAPLSTDDTKSFEAQFFVVPGTGSEYIDATYSLVRQRIVGDGFYEQITVMNHGTEPIQPELVIEADADFADLFEVKDVLAKKGETYRRVEPERLTIGYRRGDYVRETWIQPLAEGATVDEHGLRFSPRIEPHGVWHGGVEVVAAIDGTAGGHAHARYRTGEEQGPTIVGHFGPRFVLLNRHVSAEELRAVAPRLECDWEDLRHTLRRSVLDLMALRFYPFEGSDVAVPAAGLPWFQTLFGRDSLITGYQTILLVPGMVSSILDVLSRAQATEVDDFRDAEPGRILHELRLGELTVFHERPHSPYYGSADATQLFLILLDEFERWSGDADTVRRLEPAARAALRWIDEYGDRDRDGYVEYERRNTETGLENQCWKDSWNSIMYADGTLAKLPRATCELQGYVYDAKRRCARLAREVWNDLELATRLEAEADELKRRFNQDFWLDDRGYYALALDGDKRPVDSLTSNIGHLLWSGIVDDDKASSVVAHLMGDRLFSGWGIRTMAEGDGGYNPIGYHQGTVWPHDNSIIAAGLRRYGFPEEAARVAQAIFEAAPYFNGRLPEAFAGYARDITHYPVEYPTACSPQAWASAAPLLLLRVILGAEPADDGLRIDPVLPPRLSRLELHGIRGRWGTTDVVAERAAVVV